MSSQEEDTALRPSKQLKIGDQSQERRVVDTTSSEVQAWLPAPMLHGEPLRDNASLRDFNEGEGTRVADALERSLLLPTDMAELNSLTSEQGAANDQREDLKRERAWRYQATTTLKNSEADLAKAREALTAVTRERDNALSDFEGAQTQANEQTRRLGQAEEQLQIARDLIADLQAKAAKAEKSQRGAEWARDQALWAKDEAENCRKLAERAKKKAESAAYADGMASVEAAYKAQVPGVCRRYCSQVWPEALKQAGVEAASDLWKAENVYFPPAIREAVPEDPTVGEIIEEVRAVELGEHSGEEAPQEIVKIPSDDPASTTEEAVALAVPPQTVPLGQGSEGSGVATVQPEQKE
ncbi:uncharacterized protein LOC136064847 [Quercus suber]|uniref:uncharacterized protein LOC136064847 n=1 Tax=Quercus suber TaxID=58331 RepID=UPI0032DFBC32